MAEQYVIPEYCAFCEHNRFSHNKRIYALSNSLLNSDRCSSQQCGSYIMKTSSHTLDILKCHFIIFLNDVLQQFAGKKKLSPNILPFSSYN